MTNQIVRGSPLVLFGLTLIWYAALVVRFDSHGAIGDDPATYVMMAGDLAERGTVTPEFSLFTNLFDEGFSWDAFLTPGYHVVRETGAIAPNFAFGLPLLLAIGYRVFGEGAFVWATPLMGGLALVVTFALANEFWRELTPTRRYWIGALAVLLLATTPKQIQLALVPMSDVPTQLFCALAMWAALRGGRNANSRLLYAAACGVALGLAYLMRHSALVMTVPLAIVAMEWGGNWRKRAIPILMALAVMGLVILPDVVYRANVLGSPFAVESLESTRVVWGAAFGQFVGTFASLFSVTGFGPVLLAALALVVGMREGGERRATVVLAMWVLVFVVFHAPLQLTGVFENNLRYLLPAYPAIALLIARGMVVVWDWAWDAVRGLRKGRRTIGGVGAVLGLVIVVGLFLVSLRAAAGPERFVMRSYGWMSETARADMDALAESLPPNAVIGVSDQMAGAAVLYLRRNVFRPASFVEGEREFARFLERMRTEGREVFLMGDWECAPVGGASEKLPEWLGKFGAEEMGMRVEGLPYECAQRVHHIIGD